MQNFFNVCRVCMNVDTPQNLLPLFDRNKKHTQKILLMTGIQIDDEYRDLLPDKICINCSVKFQQAYEIISLFLKNDTTLREWVIQDQSKDQDLEIEIIDLDTEEENNDQCTNDSEDFPLDPLLEGESNVLREPANNQIKTKPKSKKIPCNICGKSYYKTSMHRHQAVHQKRLINKECDPSLEGEPDFQSEANRNRLKPKSCNTKRTCNICGKSFYKSSMERHKEVHRKESIRLEDKSQIRPKGLASKSMKKLCNFCGKSYNKCYLKRHQKAVHQKEPISYECDYCGMEFAFKSFINMHMLKKHARKKWACKSCDNSYGMESALIAHTKKHSPGVQIYKCSVDHCGWSFFKKKQLTTHTRVHTDDRRYDCMICGRKFLHHTDHKRHVMRHTGERPYKCTFQDCTRAYIKRSELQHHEKMQHNKSIDCGNEETAYSVEWEDDL